MYSNQRAFMWISSVASVLLWNAVKNPGVSLHSPLCFMFVLSDEPTDSVFLRKFAMPPALRVHYHPASLPQLPQRGMDKLVASNAVPLFANNGIDWWLGQRTSSGRPRAFSDKLIAAQVRSCEQN